jgi:hypothetical protein
VSCITDLLNIGNEHKQCETPNLSVLFTVKGSHVYWLIGGIMTQTKVGLNWLSVFRGKDLQITFS